MKVQRIGGLEFDANIYLVIDERTTLIDAGTSESFETARDGLRRFGVTPEDIDLILNTHCHYDHAGGDHNFLRASNCKIAIHELEAGLLEKGNQTITFAAALGRKFEPVDVAMRLKDNDNVGLGKSSLKVLHTPGHTAGSVCFYEPKNRLLFSGDTIFSNSVGRTDLETGNGAALRTSIERLLKLDVQNICPGHGPLVEKNAHACILNASRFAYL